MPDTLAFECAPPFLVAHLHRPHKTLGWTLLNPGFALAERVVWLEVRNADLTMDVDPAGFLRDKMQAAGHGKALAFMTSRDIRQHHFHRTVVEGISAACLTTVGLSNAERVGTRHKAQRHAAGTINTLVQVSTPLSDGAFVEAMSIATQARTAAIMEARPGVTGTGTDCIIIAAPLQGEGATAAGLHTALGEAVGAAVFKATAAGAKQWLADEQSLSA